MDDKELKKYFSDLADNKNIYNFWKHKQEIAKNIVKYVDASEQCQLRLEEDSYSLYKLISALEYLCALKGYIVKYEGERWCVFQQDRNLSWNKLNESHDTATEAFIAILNLIFDSNYPGIPIA